MPDVRDAFRSIAEGSSPATELPVQRAAVGFADPLTNEMAGPMEISKEMNDNKEPIDCWTTWALPPSPGLSPMTGQVRELGCGARAALSTPCREKGALAGPTWKPGTLKACALDSLEQFERGCTKRQSYMILASHTNFPFSDLLEQLQCCRMPGIFSEGNECRMPVLVTGKAHTPKQNSCFEQSLEPTQPADPVECAQSSFLMDAECLANLRPKQIVVLDCH